MKHLKMLFFMKNLLKYSIFFSKEMVADHAKSEDSDCFQKGRGSTFTGAEIDFKFCWCCSRCPFIDEQSWDNVRLVDIFDANDDDHPIDCVELMNIWTKEDSELPCQKLYWLLWVDEPPAFLRHLLRRRPLPLLKQWSVFSSHEAAESVHFFRPWTMSSCIGHKILAVRVLDIKSNILDFLARWFPHHVRLSCLDALVPSCHGAHRHIEFATALQRIRNGDVSSFSPTIRLCWWHSRKQSWTRSKTITLTSSI